METDTLAARPYIFNLPDPVTGKNLHITFSPVTLVRYYELIQAHGVATAVELALEGLRLTLHEVTDEDEQRLHTIMQAIKRDFDLWQDKETFVLAYTYDGLRLKRLTYDQAAADASMLLGRTITTGAWRMALARWAEKQGLPTAVQRPRKGSTDQ